MGDGIFISYRRDDSLGWSGRIYDQLWPAFGKDRVFFDLDSLYPGVDWDEAIDRTVEECAIVVLVVGPRWVTIEDSRGNRRLELDDDKHAYEVATALESGKPVIPVTIDGAVMPDGSELPERLRRLTRKQAFTLTPAAFYHQIEVLVETLQRVVTPVDEPAPSPASDITRTATGPTAAVGPSVPTEESPSERVGEPVGAAEPGADAPMGEAPVSEGQGPAAVASPGPDEPDAPTSTPTPPDLAEIDAEEVQALEHARQGEFEQAMRIEEGVLEARRRALRDDHPNTLLARNNLAIWRAAVGDVEAAEAEFRSVLEDRERVLGHEHADTVSTTVELANLIYRQGDVDGAAVLEEGVLAARRRTLGDVHPDTLTAMRNLVVSYRALGRYGDAVALLDELADVATRQHGAGSSDSLLARQALALSRYDFGDIGDAIDLQRGVVAGWEDGDPDDPEAFTAKFVLGCWLRETGDLAGARRMEEQAYQGRRQLLGPDDPVTLDAAANLAVTQFMLGDAAGAKALFADVVERRLRVLGPDHPDTISAQRALDSEELAGVALTSELDHLVEETAETVEPESTAPPSAPAPSSPSAPTRTPPEPATHAGDPASPTTSAGAGGTIRVSPSGGADHESIAAAVRVAPAHSTILVEPGEYGPVVIQRPVRIVARAEAGEVVIASVDGSCIQSRATEAHLEGLTLVCRGKKQSIVEIESGTLTLERCDLSATREASVTGVVARRAEVVLRSTSVHDCETGVKVRRAHIERSQFHALDGTAIDLMHGEHLTLVDSEVRDVEQRGVLLGNPTLADARVEAEITGCTFMEVGDAVRPTIDVGKRCQASIRRCHIEAVDGFAVAVGKNASLTIEQCTLVDVGRKLRQRPSKAFQGVIKVPNGATVEARNLTLDGSALGTGGT